MRCVVSAALRIGKRADLIGRHDVGDVRRGLLLVERARLRVADVLRRHGHQLFERDRLELDLLPRHRAGRDRHRDLLILASQVGDQDGVHARGHAGEPERAGVVGGRRHGGVLDDDGGARQRVAGARIEHAPFDRRRRGLAPARGFAPIRTQCQQQRAQPADGHEHPSSSDSFRPRRSNCPHGNMHSSPLMRTEVCERCRGVSRS